MGGETLLLWESKNSFKLHKGTILVCLNGQEPLKISSQKGSADIIGPCTFIAEVTSNGGYKLICLSGKPVIRTGNDNAKIHAGRLVLVLGETDSLGSAYDINLLLLLQSSLLINGFTDPPPTMKKIGLAVYSQQLRIGGKYNALIGDAVNDEDLQMWVLGKKGTDTKPSK